MALWSLLWNRSKHITSTTRVVRFLFVEVTMSLRFHLRYDVYMEQVLLHGGLYRGLCSTAWRERYCRFVAGYLVDGQSWSCRLWCVLRGNGTCFVFCFRIVNLTA